MTRIYTFLIMYLFWIVLSGKFDLFHLSLGVISCLIVTFISGDLLFTDKSRKGRLSEALRFIKYIPWLIYQIIAANFHVAYVALHPRMREMINPQVIRFKTKLKSDISRVTFANSITLTPGTITIKIKDDEFFVHALTDKSAEGLPGDMEERIAGTFKEG